MTAFGSDRLIWGGNWPVITLHVTFEAQIAIAEEYLAPFGTAVRDQAMFKNALAFDRRHRPGASPARPIGAPAVHWPSVDGESLLLSSPLTGGNWPILLKNSPSDQTVAQATRPLTG